MPNDPIVVVGLGPAGAAAARLLAAWGHDVVAIDRPGGDAGRLAESIPPSASKILRAIGAIDAVSAANFLPWRGNTVWWANEPARVESFADSAAGWQVLRRDFDRCLRRLAVDAGARVIEGRVTDVMLAAGPEDSSVVEVEHNGTTTEHRASTVIDASGRAGVVARDGLRVLDPSARTIAIAGTWQRETRWPVGDPSHTLVASYAGGWAWSVPVSDDVRQFTVMVDPSRTDLVRGAPSREIYLAEVSKVEALRPILEGATLTEAPFGADASEYTARQYAGEGFLLAGDAGSAINPLSSVGVKKALASGWLAAITAHTIVSNPAMAGEARLFFDRRERAVAASAARQARAFAREAAAQTGHPFWLARTDAGSTVDDFDPDTAALANDPTVQAAFRNLRARDHLRLVQAPDVRIEPRAAVRGREIVMDDHLITRAWPEGLRYLRGVDLVALVRLAPGHADAGELFEAVRKSTPDITLPDFLGALSVLIATGCLQHG